MFENRVLTRICETMRDEVTGGGGVEEKTAYQAVS
jgi:hypothetical protein